MTMPVTVLLAEPDAMTRVGIRMALDAAGIEVCCEPLDATSVAADAWSERPLVCLIDDCLPGGALVALDAINRRMPEVKLLLLTEAEEPKNLLSAIRAGASGYIRKDLDPTRIADTICGVLNGEAALSRTMTMRLIEALRRRDRGRSAPTTPGGPSMTDRELEVLELMTEGLRTSEISDRLSISEVTVRRHTSSAVAKLGVADRGAAIAVLTGRSQI